jgi:large subunit ribosomal protein L22
VILDHVRGLSVMQAEATLQFSPRAAARDVLGLLRSATANAKENHDIDKAELVIDHCYADEDRTLKRFKPRARGRASSIHKRMCHVTIVLRHVAVAEPRDISAAQATIAAESRRSRARTAQAAAAPAAEVEAPEVEESSAEEAAAPRPKAARKPKAAKPEAGEADAAEAEAEDDDPKAAAPKAPRKPRTARPAPEDAASDAAEAAAPRASRKKPAPKPTEPASLPADDADETAADEGDS